MVIVKINFFPLDEKFPGSWTCNGYGSLIVNLKTDCLAFRMRKFLNYFSLRKSILAFFITNLTLARPIKSCLPILPFRFFNQSYPPRNNSHPDNFCLSFKFLEGKIL